MEHPDFDLVIFDCDGVLIDSESISARILITLLKPFGLDFDLVHMQRHFLGRSFPTVAAKIRHEYDIDLPADFELSYRRTLLEAFQLELKATEGIEGILAILPIRYCVASSSSPERVARSLCITGLSKYFQDSIFTASEVKHGKPAPDIFLHVAACCTVAPDRCLVIEDSRSGIEAAQAAGMTVWRYIGGSHLSDIRPSIAHEITTVPSFGSWSNFSDMLHAGREISDW